LAHRKWPRKRDVQFPALIVFSLVLVESEINFTSKPKRAAVKSTNQSENKIAAPGSCLKPKYALANGKIINRDVYYSTCHSPVDRPINKNYPPSKQSCLQRHWTCAAGAEITQLADGRQSGPCGRLGRLKKDAMAPSRKAGAADCEITIARRTGLIADGCAADPCRLSHLRAVTLQPIGIKDFVQK
jgi:hypothetical protein